ncbi:MAG TPA: acyl-CoA dehydrogenase [Woeseiaceae bacterium]|nr:acyl-CoA dehydrogenase [Woeseiaceae bacterium]|tara:strand:+ start:8341 stop:9477 length:1137 start_codon:yes stop_codon:yes gene_type:complete
MNFSITEEQSAIKDVISRFIDNEYDFERRMKIADGETAFNSEVYNFFVEQGFTAIPFSADDGGLDGGPVEIMLIMKEIGRGLMLEPFMENIILAGGILKKLGTKHQKENWLSKIIGGEIQAALAFTEPQSRFNLNDIATSAKKQKDGYLINGKKSFVLNGQDADLIIVPARTSGAQSDANGITLFAIEKECKGIEINSYKTVDGHSAAEITFSDVELNTDAIIGEVDSGLPCLQNTIDEATLAVCAEAIGIMRSLHDKTVEYSKNRMQFGIPIGGFQALQHRMVDNLMACEESESILLWAITTNTDDEKATQKAISGLKYQIGTAGKHVGQEAVQLHGGMGISWELDIAHLFKRLSAIEILFGNADFHLERFIKLSNN